MKCIRFDVCKVEHVDEVEHVQPVLNEVHTF